MGGSGGAVILPKSDERQSASHRVGDARRAVPIDSGPPLAVVQWIERAPPKRQIQVRFLSAGPEWKPAVSEEDRKPWRNLNSGAFSFPSVPLGILDTELSRDSGGSRAGFQLAGIRRCPSADARRTACQPSGSRNGIPGSQTWKISIRRRSIALLLYPVCGTPGSSTKAWPGPTTIGARPSIASVKRPSTHVHDHGRAMAVEHGPIARPESGREHAHFLFGPVGMPVTADSRRTTVGATSRPGTGSGATAPRRSAPAVIMASPPSSARP